MKLDLYITASTKINLKWTEDFNTRPETVKFQEENIVKSFMTLVLAMSSRYDTKSPGTKSKNR